MAARLLRRSTQRKSLRGFWPLFAVALKNSLCHLIGLWQGSDRIANDPSRNNPNELLDLVFGEWYAILEDCRNNHSQCRPKSLAFDKFA
jgi:hypothetical protein